jgi:5-methylcytosine-specific restriction endonuclease McrA
MKQDGGLCVMCKADGILNKANVVDHIIEIKDGGEPFDIKNTQSLCHLHHNKKSALERKKRDAL